MSEFDLPDNEAFEATKRAKEAGPMKSAFETLDVSMCWDGETATAAITINGKSFVGAPTDVKKAFDTLNATRDRLDHYRRNLERLDLEIGRLSDGFWLGEADR